VIFSPAKVQLVKRVPSGRGWLYEPKFDGYRGIVARESSGRVLIRSRNDKDLGRFFPELIRLAEMLPTGTVIDGEIVRPVVGGVSFVELQRRLMIPLKDRPSVAAERPVAFVAFDVLMDRSEDTRRLGLKVRRQRLERIVQTANDSSLQLILQTSEVAAAIGWLDDSLPMTGIEGVVAKRDEPYPRPNVRRWQKVRRTATMDVLIAGFIGDLPTPRLVVGTDDGGKLRILGTTLPISPEDAARLEPLVPMAVRGERPIWSVFESERHDEWFQIPVGLMAEVAYSHLDGDRFRQAVRFLRWRLHQPPE